MNKLFAYIVVGMPLIFGAVTAAGAQTLSEIGSATGVGVSYTGSSLTLTGDPSGSYSSHNGSATIGTYTGTYETFYSNATSSNVFNATGGSATGAGQNFGSGYFTITQGSTTLLGGTFDNLMFNEFVNSTGDITLSNVDYFGTLFPTTFNATAVANTGSLTFNYPAGSGGNFNTTDASTYYSVKNASAVPELSPVSVVGLGALGLMGMLFAQGRSKRTSRASL